MPAKVTLPLSEIARWYEAGVSTSALGARYGVSSTTVAKYLRRHGVQLRPCGQRATLRNRLDVAELVRLYRTGLSLHGLAKTMGCSVRSVRRILSEEDVPVRRCGAFSRSRIPIDIERAKELYASGLSITRVASMLNVSIATLHSRLVDHGWVARPPGSTQRLSLEKQDEIERLLMRGKTYAQIRAEAGVSCDPVARVVHERGIERQNRGSSAAPMGRVWLYGPGEQPVKRWCSRCEQHKPVASFAAHRGRKHGLNTTCRSCVGGHHHIQQESVSPR